MTSSTPEMAPRSPNLLTTPEGGLLAPMYDLTCNRPQCTTDIQWNRALNQEPSGPEDETFPLVHRGLPLNGYARGCKKYNLELNISKIKRRNRYSIATRPTELQKFLILDIYFN
ncbi:hypothetical protein AVEN_85298-1 [Araneus ventricosus]|uniref:Uncharacterized protein n=1 Tax=Araneus ventricosus TaxID=182803 RepID=A0A4Y2VNB3_ARAVE|nr:hypothetical protein AVEN_85298-1 [Araneus ventricosus]